MTNPFNRYVPIERRIAETRVRMTDAQEKHEKAMLLPEEEARRASAETTRYFNIASAIALAFVTVLGVLAIALWSCP